jgi:uncharacterized protein
MINKTLSLLFISLSCACLLSSCGQNEEKTTETKHKEIVVSEDTLIVEYIEQTIPLDSIFTPLDTSFTHNVLLVPEGFKIQILFSEKIDLVTKADGSKHPAKGNHDQLAFIPDEDNPSIGWLFVSHETKYADPNLGDGGGATMFRIARDENNQWNMLSEYEHVDFSGVGNTDRNCGGAVGPNGMIYTCEEYEPKDNATINRQGKGHTKTDSVGNLDYWQNIGYVVEVDPKTRKATQKMIAMGRYFHEDLEFMEDNKTVYLSDDFEPAVFFKFVADKELDYSQGQLYAYKQGETEGTAGTWLPLARDTATMIRARDAAIELGATMYMRHEWFGRVGNKIYIGETGHDETDWSKRIKQGGNISHALQRKAEGNIVRDVHGRVLVFDTETDIMLTHLEGGIAKDGATVFSNPDCITPARLGGKDYIIIHEDINWNDKGRVPEHAYKKNKFYCELYFLDLSIEQPTLEDLKRFAIAPMGAELTGGIMSPDGSTLFLNVQHPHASNGAPYNRSITVAITGWDR